MSDTVTENLEPYRLPEKLRTLRLQKSMGLVQLSRHTGLSPAMLSKLECGKAVPTLPTLLRIALVFGVGLDHFFSTSRRHTVAVVKKKDRIQLRAVEEGTGGSYTYESLDFKANERKLNAYLAEFHEVPPDKLTPHHHPGVELIYVLGGTLALVIGQEEHRLQAGDAVYFDSNARHSYRRAGRQVCTAMVVTTK